jgi:hypothetical protein
MKLRTDITINGKRAGDFPASVHVIPFLYYILYTFLLYQLVLDISGTRENPERKKTVEGFYVVGSVLVYGVLYLNRPG